jgi:hypothetical protein
VIPLRDWATRALGANHVLVDQDVFVRTPAVIDYTTPNRDLGASGVFISWIMEQHVGLNNLSGTGGLNDYLDLSNWFSQRTSEYELYLWHVRQQLAQDLRPYVGKSAAQLPTSTTIHIRAPAAPTGLADPTGDLVGAIVNGLIGAASTLVGGLGPLVVGGIILVAILVLLYMGAKRTLL